MREHRHTVDDLLAKLDVVRELLNTTTGSAYDRFTLKHPDVRGGVWSATIGAPGARDVNLPGTYGGFIGGYLGRTKNEAAHTLDTILWTLQAVRRTMPEQSVTEELAHLRAQLVDTRAERDRAEDKLSAFTWPSQP